METEIIDRLFLELSQVTRASTAKEIAQAKEVCRLAQGVDAAINAMRSYAAANPVHHDRSGVEQDPNGVHRWLREFDRGHRPSE